MAVFKIPEKEQGLLCASVFIRSFKRVIEELVYNALDAESNSIAIRVCIQDHFIQVLDNGNGITKKDFKLIGQKYATSKFIDYTSLKSAPSIYGFRGLSLTNIIEVSETVKISSRFHKARKTWIKIFDKGNKFEIRETDTRPSKGTTVEIMGFLYNLNIQRKSIDPLVEVRNIKTFLEQLSLIHCDVSMSLRDDSKNEIIFKIHKNRNLYHTLSTLFEINQNNFQELQVEKKQYKVKGLIGKRYFESIKYQWIYLNGIFVTKTRLHKIVNDSLSKTFCPKIMNKTKKKHDFKDENYSCHKNIPFYFMFISCPYGDIDIMYKRNYTLVQFKNPDEIEKLIKKLIHFYSGDLVKLKPVLNKVSQSKRENNETRKKVKEIMDKILGSNTKKSKISQIHNGIKGKNIKRKKKTQKKINQDLLNAKNTSSLSKQIKNANVLNLANSNKEDCNTQLSNGVKSNMEKNNFKKSCKNIPNGNFKIIRNNKKTLKAVHKSKKIQNKLLKKFEDQSDTLKKRCKSLSCQVRDLLNINSVENIVENNSLESSRIIGDKHISQYVTPEYFHNQSNHDMSSLTYNDTRMNKSHCVINKVPPTSHDLIKTIIDTDNVDNNAHIENTIKTLSVCDKSQQFIQLFTYESHNYKNLNKKRFSVAKQFITSQSCRNFITGRKRNQTTYVSKPIMKKRTSNRKTNMNVYYKRDNNFLRNIDKNQSSYTIELSKSYSNRQNKLQNQLYSAEHDIMTFNSINTLNNSNHKILPVYSTNVKLMSTYSINANSSEQILHHDCDLVRPRFNETYSIQMSKSFNYWNNEQEMELNNPENSCNIIEVEENNINNIIISETANSTSESLIPIQFCETLLDGNDLKGVEEEFNVSFIDNNKNTLHSHQDLDTNDNTNLITCYDNGLNKISYHFDQSKEKYGTIVNETYINIDSYPKKILEGETNTRDFQTSLQEIRRSIDYEDKFQLKKRKHFMPKGMSPINNRIYTKNACNYDFENDERFYDNDIYTNFAEDVLINTEIFESVIQNVNDILPKGLQKINQKLNEEKSDLNFNLQSIKEAKVLGQVDCKFIATKIKGKCTGTINYVDYLVLFDQHAVDERIRLERNLLEYIDNGEWKSIPLDSTVLKINKDDFLYLHNDKDKFTQFGLQWTFGKGEIFIKSIPKAILGKNPRQTDVILKAVNRLISEQIEAINSCGGNVSLYPKSIMELVFSEACRYAIKFGDRLSKEKCTVLLESLAGCKTPFQCAHGRPVMAVIMELPEDINKYTVNLKKIKNFKDAFKI